jgi:hypothetical protein
MVFCIQGLSVWASIALLPLFDSRYQQKSAEYGTECSLFFERVLLLVLNINLPM